MEGSSCLVNDNSAGNDQIIADKSIKSVADLKGKTVAVEEGVVDDFLLVLALNDVGLTRDDVIIKGLPTDQAATAFAQEKLMQLVHSLHLQELQ